jgi:hypothetical protein
MSVSSANWFGIRCWIRMCGFRPNDITFGPIGAHCCTPGCERQIIFEDDWKWPRRRHGKPTQVHPKDVITPIKAARG